jgi:hypothetical protein
MAQPATRISIGFHASPPVALRVDDDQLSKLQKALGGDGWHTVIAEDSEVTLALHHVLWLRVDKDDHKVGFGLST